jgi:hypothetical protein
MLQYKISYDIIKIGMSHMMAVSILTYTFQASLIDF